MRTETYNALRDEAANAVAGLNADLVVWASDPVGVGTTYTSEFSSFNDETYEFLKDRLQHIKLHTDIIAKLDELHGV